MPKAFPPECHDRDGCSDLSARVGAARVPAAGVLPGRWITATWISARFRRSAALIR